MNTLTITNLGGPLTRRDDGEINSGLAKFDSSWGYDPYLKPGNLTWMEQPSSLLTLSGTAGPLAILKNRVTVATNTAYTVAGNKNLYEIKVSSSNNPNLDSVSVLGAIPVAPNFTRSAGMVFYGSTEKIFVSDDNSIQKINFNGSSPASINGTSSLLASTPHPMATFLGKIYFGNGNNIGEIDSTELMTTGTKLNPALPSGLFIKDIDVTTDGNYLQMTASRANSSGDLNGNSQDVGSPTGLESYKFLWNGIDDGGTASEVYGGLSAASSNVFGDKNYTIGYSSNGVGIFSGSNKIVSVPKAQAPYPQAGFTVSGMLGFAVTEYDDSDGKFKASVYNYGQYDNETPAGLFRILRQTASGNDDFTTIPTCANISNLVYAPSIFGLPQNTSGQGKIYYTTVQGSVAGGTFEHKLWKFYTAPIGVNSVVSGVYETQNQLFSKKVKVGEVRFYTEPLVADNSFSIGIVNSASSIIATNTYTVGSNVTAGEDVVRWTPQIAPTYALGLRITNLGSKNWVGTKLEVDTTESGT